MRARARVCWSQGRSGRAESGDRAASRCPPPPRPGPGWGEEQEKGFQGRYPPPQTLTWAVLWNLWDPQPLVIGT